MALSRFCHANIVGFRGLVTEDDYLYCLMDYVEGENLGKRIERVCRLEGGFLPLAEVLTIATNIAKALVHAHSKNVIHRDIKPDNIMVTADGRAVLLDFGLAQVRDLCPLIPFNRSPGTVAYFAPEQMRGSQTDERTDMYQFGLTLYEALTGKLPFPDDHPFDGMYRRLHENIPPPSILNKNCSLTLDALVGRCLLPKRDKRFSSMAEVSHILESSLQSTLISEKPRNVLNPFKRTKKSHISIAT